MGQRSAYVLRWLRSFLFMKRCSMQKKFLMLVCILALFTAIAVSVYAEDLPIDISAIGRQDIQEGQITTRVGANLFTTDSERVNEALAEQIRQRQAIASYLFTYVSPNHEVDPHIQIVNAANNAALFTQPVFFTSATQPQNADTIPLWIFVSIIAVCAIVGFIWALISISKKKGQQDGVH